MKKTRSVGILALSLLFVVPAFAAPTVLQFWHSMGGQKGKLLKEIVAEFNSLPENKDRLEIQVQFVGSYEEGLNKLRTALLGGRGPHVVQITDIGQRVMIDSGAVTPLQNFIDLDPEFPIKEILPPIRRYYELNQRLYSLPFATSNPILYYNADAFKRAGVEKPPSTFKELEEISRKLTDPKARVQGITWPLNSWFFEEFMARQGAPLINPKNGRVERANEANYTCPEGVEFVSLWKKMVQEGTLANVGRGWDPAEQNFIAGRTAMLITSTSDIFEVLKEAPFKLGTAPIPARTLSDRGGTVIGGNSLWILNNKPIAEQKAAYRFLKFMASPSVQEKWHSNTGYFPIRADVIDALKKRGFYDKYPVAWTAIEQMRASPDMDATRGALMGVFPEAREHIATAIEEVLAGRAEVLSALRNAKAKTDFSLMRYNRGKSD